MLAIWANFRDRRLVQQYSILVCLSSLVMGIHGCSFGGKVENGSFSVGASLGSLPTETSQETVEKVSQLVKDASQKLDRRDFSGAIMDMDRAIAIAPEAAMPYNYRGMVYLHAENPTSALTDFDRALKIQPDNLQFKKHRLLANALVKARQSDVQGSRSELEKLIELDPQDGSSYYHRGLWYRETGNEAAAITDFEQALKLEPGLAEAKKVLKQVIQ